MNIEISRQVTGWFSVTVDGVQKYEIINGSLGVSGHGKNMYGIKNIHTGKITWIGSLQACKKMVTYWINKEGETK